MLCELFNTVHRDRFALLSSDLVAVFGTRHSKERHFCLSNLASLQRYAKRTVLHLALMPSSPRIFRQIRTIVPTHPVSSRPLQTPLVPCLVTTRTLTSGKIWMKCLPWKSL